MSRDVLANLGELTELSSATRQARGAVILADPSTPGVELVLAIAAEVAHGENLPLTFLSPGSARNLRRRGDLPTPCATRSPWSLTRSAIEPGGVLVVDLAGIPENAYLRSLVAFAVAHAQYVYAAGHPWSDKAAAIRATATRPIRRSRPLRKGFT